MTISELRVERDNLITVATQKSKLKKSLYGGAKIDTRMSAEEKQLTKEVANLWSNINQINVKIAELRK